MEITLQVNTQRYIEDMFASCPEPVPCDFALGSQCVDASTRMPLCHALAGGKRVTRFLMDSDAALKSRRAQGRPASPAREFVGTEDYVFFWLGPLRFDRQAGLVFAPQIETASVLASPWDTGGLHRHVAQERTDAERLALLRNRTFGAPGHRTALATAILLRHDTPTAYIGGNIVRNVDPDRICDQADPSTFTFEARFASSVRVKADGLRFAAARRDAMDAGLNSLRSWCLREGVPFEVVGPSDRHQTVQSAIEAYVLKVST
jgi:hypothetical protein